MKAATRDLVRQTGRGGRRSRPRLRLVPQVPRPGAPPWPETMSRLSAVLEVELRKRGLDTASRAVLTVECVKGKESS